jgi:5-methyltetrahydropteroyltriglutamate--homocysteine methyltransferase
MPPFRAEVIGSLLRPRRLKDAGRAMQEGRLPAAEYQAILDEEIARVIARQESVPRDFLAKSGTIESPWFRFVPSAFGCFCPHPARR